MIVDGDAVRVERSDENPAFDGFWRAKVPLLHAATAEVYAENAVGSGRPETVQVAPAQLPGSVQELRVTRREPRSVWIGWTIEDPPGAPVLARRSGSR